MNKLDLIIDALEMAEVSDENKQPEALRLAAFLDSLDVRSIDRIQNCVSAAAELRRLHEVNQELLEVLKKLCKAADNGHVADYSNLWDEARTALVKATGEST